MIARVFSHGVATAIPSANVDILSSVVRLLFANDLCILADPSASTHSMVVSGLWEAKTVDTHAQSHHHPIGMRM